MKQNKRKKEIVDLLKEIQTNRLDLIQRFIRLDRKALITATSLCQEAGDGFAILAEIIRRSNTGDKVGADERIKGLRWSLNMPYDFWINYDKLID